MRSQNVGFLVFFKRGYCIYKLCYTSQQYVMRNKIIFSKFKFFTLELRHKFLPFIKILLNIKNLGIYIITYDLMIFSNAPVKFK